MSRYLIMIEATSTGFSAYCPDLPGCVATGGAREEVKLAMRGATLALTDGDRGLLTGSDPPRWGRFPFQGGCGVRDGCGSKEIPLPYLDSRWLFR